MPLKKNWYKKSDLILDHLNIAAFTKSRARFFNFQEELKAKRLGGAGRLLQMKERFVNVGDNYVLFSTILCEFTK